MAEMDRDREEYLDLARREHREDPRAFFVEILQNLWGDREEEQTLFEWKRLCTEVRWYAEDALSCLDTILADPPADLAELMQNEGSIMLDHGPGRYTVLTWYRQQYLEWLTDRTQSFRVIFEDSRRC